MKLYESALAESRRLELQYLQSVKTLETLTAHIETLQQRLGVLGWIAEPEVKLGRLPQHTAAVLTWMRTTTEPEPMEVCGEVYITPDGRFTYTASIRVNGAKPLDCALGSGVLPTLPSQAFIKFLVAYFHDLDQPLVPPIRFA